MAYRWTRINTKLLLFTLISASYELKVDDSIHYGISFRSPEQENLQRAELLKVAPNEDQETLTIISHDEERYVCHIPADVDMKQRKRLASYTGPSPEELLRPIYKEKMCSLKLEPYWGYEVCHGRYVVQFHEERELKAITRIEYYLGNFQQDYATKANFKFDQLNPPTKIIDDEVTPYYPVAYTKGTLCDITGKHRTITVLYICHESGEENIHSLSEVSSCNYEAIVLTSRLCSHPAFTPPTKKSYEIVCYDQNGRSNPKPAALIEQEEYHANTFKREYSYIPKRDQHEMSSDETLLAERLNREYEELERRKLEQIAGDKHLKGKSKLTTYGKGRSTQDAMSPDTQKINDQIAIDTINRILSGNECIQGGSGWWKYEFCYGRTVTQFHVHPSGERQSIILGNFDEAVHKAWIKENEKKRPIKHNGKVQQVSQIYVKGDMCDETRSHRSVEVKLRCKSVDGSKLAIGIFLEEPTICNYILTLESARFCTVLEEVDDYGLFDTVALAQKVL